MSSIYCRVLAFGAAVLLIATPCYSQVQAGPAYLVYAGPHSSSPASAFGHLFLVLAETPDTPLPLWDVVSFAAETEGAAPFAFFATGIVGGFQGTYERLTFHEKSRDYEALDDRDLWLLELQLSVEQRQALAEIIAETRGQRYPYTFFIRNCAYYLQQLLVHAGVLVDPPAGLTSPIDVWTLLQDSGIGVQTLFRPSLSMHLEGRLGQLRNEQLHQLRQTRWEELAADTAWIRTLTPTERVAVNEYVAWRSLRRTTLLPPATAAGLASLRNHMAGDAPDSPPSNGGVHERTVGRRVPPNAFHRYTRVSGSYSIGNGDERLRLRFRPALHDAADPWVGHRLINTLEFLSVEVSSRPESGDLRLESFVLFSQRSLNPTSWLDKPQSWMLEAQLERGGLSGRGLQGILRTGAGKAHRLGAIHGYGLLTTGAAASADQATLSVGLEMGVLALIGDNLRGGARWLHERDALHPRQVGYTRGIAWLRRDLSKQSGLRLVAEWTSHSATYSVGADWYVH